MSITKEALEWAELREQVKRGEITDGVAAARIDALTSEAIDDALFARDTKTVCSTSLRCSPRK